MQGEWPTRNKYGNCLCCMSFASNKMQFRTREAPTAATRPEAWAGTMTGRDGWQLVEPKLCTQPSDLAQRQIRCAMSPLTQHLGPFNPCSLFRPICCNSCICMARVGHARAGATRPTTLVHAFSRQQTCTCPKSGVSPLVIRLVVFSLV